MVSPSASDQPSRWTTHPGIHYPEARVGSRRDITPNGIMTAPAVSAATTATRPTAGASGMNGVQLPVTALVTASRVTAPAAAPATSPVPATNTACQPNTA